MASSKKLLATWYREWQSTHLHMCKWLTCALDPKHIYAQEARLEGRLTRTGCGHTCAQDAMYETATLSCLNWGNRVGNKGRVGTRGKALYKTNSPLGLWIKGTGGEEGNKGTGEQRRTRGRIYKRNKPLAYSVRGTKEQGRNKGTGEQGHQGYGT